MARLDWDAPFSHSRFLLCEAVLSRTGDDCLLFLVERRVVAERASLTIGSATISDLSVVGEAPDALRWLVYWRNAPAFKSASESYNFTPSTGAVVGPPSRCYRLDESPWLAEMKVGDLLDCLSPNCHHFSVITDHKIIDVLSPREPHVEVLSDDDDLVTLLSRQPYDKDEQSS